MDNKIKNLKYKDLMEKLKKAVEDDFHYEAIFIEFAIFEDRTESLLKHAGYPIKNDDGKDYSIYDKLMMIKTYPKYKDEYISKHLTKDLFDRIDTWRKRRNKLIHDLINCPYNNEQIKNISLEGYELIKILNNKSTLVNKYLDDLLK